MDRGELEGLDREALVVRAQAAGIRRARILTRPELIDELLRLDPNADEAQLRKSRGFFGRARDLVARVVERGLHLPDAADRIRELALGNVQAPIPRPEPQVMPTLTLAEIYAAQGHRARAIETLRRVLEREPEHAAAQALLARLEDTGYVVPPPRLPPEPEIEPALTDAEDTEDAPDEAEATTLETPFQKRPILGPSDGNGEAEFHLAPASEDLAPRASDDEGGGRTYAFTAPRTVVAREHVDAHANTDAVSVVPPTAAVDEIEQAPEVDECFAIPMDRDDAGRRTYVRWSISWSTIGALLGSMPKGRFVVRAHVVTPAWDGPNTETRDLVVDPDAEQATLVGLPEPSVVRVAVGWLDGAQFVPLAHSPALEMNRGRGLVIWTTKGAVPVILDDPRAASIARAVDASRRAAQAHT
ncbi:MAG: hypothetical protein JWP87_3889 [Labilithrix sp.]|nr:hypothetical protein [Labilithrix sp.]